MKVYFLIGFKGLNDIGLSCKYIFELINGLL